MGLIAKQIGSGGDYNPIPAGTHMAVCYAVVDLGTQFQETFNKYAHRVLVCWELPDERIDIDRDGKTINLPRAISRKYTMSLHKKASLRHDLESWRGKTFTDDELDGFDLKKLLGAPCLLGVIHEQRKDGKGEYATISSVMALPKTRGKATPAPKPENETVSFEIPDTEGAGFDIDDRLPEWVAEVIKGSNEYKGLSAAGKEPIQPTTVGEGRERPDDSDGDDDLPF